MSTSAARHPSARTPSGLFAYARFGIMVGGWVAFAVALVASRQTLDDIWTSVRDLPLVVEGVVWLLGFPFLAGLAIWPASWDPPQLRPYRLLVTRCVLSLSLAACLSASEFA